MSSVRWALGLLVMGVLFALAAVPALAQDVTPVPPAYQGSYNVTFPEHDDLGSHD